MMFGSIRRPSPTRSTSRGHIEPAPASRSPREARTPSSRSSPFAFRVAQAPNLAIIPQPGLLQQMVALGAVKAPPAGVVANEDKYFNAAWKSYGSVNGTFYAAPQSANMKSLVWYSPSAMSKAGYTIPTTWDDSRPCLTRSRQHRYQAVVWRYRLRNGDGGGRRPTGSRRPFGT